MLTILDKTISFLAWIYLRVNGDKVKYKDFDWTRDDTKELLRTVGLISVVTMAYYLPSIFLKWYFLIPIYIVVSIIFIFVFNYEHERNLKKKQK